MNDGPTFVGLMRSLRADPADSLTRAALADRLEESGGPGAGPAAAALRAGHVPLADLDGLAVAALWGCRFLPGSFAKRFVRTVYARVTGPGAPGQPITLSPKQYALLWALCRQHRGQIRDPRVPAEAEAVHALREGLPPPAERLTQGELPCAASGGGTSDAPGGGDATLSTGERLGCPACGKAHTMNEPCDFRK